MNFEIIPKAEASIETLMKSINRVIINPLIILLFALAMVYFIYGLVRYLLSSENEEIRKTSKQHMLWGIIGMFIMVSVFGIMNILLTTLDVPKSDIQINSGGDYNVGEMVN